MENNNSPQHDMKDSGDRGGEKSGRPARGGGNRFSRRKVCPFIMDKALVLDYKNLKIVNRFVSETGKIVPRHVSGVSAKNQRKLARHIKRARNIGFVAPLIAE